MPQSESHKVVHIYSGQCCTFTPALTHTTDGRLDALEQALDQPENTCAAVEKFIREVRKNYVETEHTSTPPPAEHFAKLSRVYGTPELSGEIALLGFSIGVVFALAVRQAVRSRPERFGDVPNWLEHQDSIRRLRDQRAALLQAMAVSVTGTDIELTDTAACITGSDIVLKSGWPQELLLFESRKPQTKTKKARVKLEKAA